jgi:hypothetical protein
MKTSLMILLLPLLFATTEVAGQATGQRPAPSTEERLTRLEQRVNRLDSVVGAGIISGVICALWAQNTGRSAWAWFFAGLIFSVISLLVLLYKNAEDIRNGRHGPRPPPGA